MMQCMTDQELCRLCIKFKETINTSQTPSVKHQPKNSHTIKVLETKLVFLEKKEFNSLFGAWKFENKQKQQKK